VANIRCRARRGVANTGAWRSVGGLDWQDGTNSGRGDGKGAWLTRGREAGLARAAGRGL
jgi:hypothetical protein